jgi:hypothetical protein
VVSHDGQCRKSVGRTDRLLCCCVICKFLEACIPKGVDVMIFCVYLSHVTLHRLWQYDLCTSHMSCKDLCFGDLSLRSPKN